MRTAINAIILREDKVLLLKKQDTWILPGGKPNPKETDPDCLCREVGEELSGTEIRIKELYGSFLGTTPHSKTRLEARAYFTDVCGLIGFPSGEISDAKFVGHEERPQYNASEITDKILDSLHRDWYL